MSKYVSKDLIQLNKDIEQLKDNYVEQADDALLIFVGTFLSDLLNCIGEEKDYKFKKTFEVFNEVFESYNDRE